MRNDEKVSPFRTVDSSSPMILDGLMKVTLGRSSAACRSSPKSLISTTCEASSRPTSFVVRSTTKLENSDLGAGHQGHQTVRATRIAGAALAQATP